MSGNVKPNSRSHHWAAVMSRGWTKASERRIQVNLSCAQCAVHCQIVPLQYVSPLSSFPVIWSPSGDTLGPSVVFEAVDVPCQAPLHICHIADYTMNFVLSLTHMLVFLFMYVMLSILLFILICSAASFVSVVVRWCIDV